MEARLRRHVGKLDSQTELYLLLCLLSVALVLILVLVACNCALTCCQCRKDRKKEKRRNIEYSDDYFRQIQALLQRQQTVEREWEEKRQTRKEYRLLSPEQATASLSRLASQSSLPVMAKVKQPAKSSLKSGGDLKEELANYNVNHSVRIKSSSGTSPSLKRKSWSAILDGKEIELNEEDVMGGSIVIVRRFEPMKMVETEKGQFTKKDGRQKSTQRASPKPRFKQADFETIV